jgi:outer membrane protein OmpA-like peptidoglycan-associated protein
MRVMLCMLLLGMGVPCFAEPEVKSAEEIEDLLTRGVKIVPKKTAEGHVIPETAQHVSLPAVLFALNSADLLPMAKRQLDQVAVALQSKALTNFRLSIDGHTCNLGDAAHNQRLSEDRAAAARSYLAQKGVSADRLFARGLGETRPIALNTSETLRQQNRRVDFMKLETTATRGITARGLPSITTRGVPSTRFLNVHFEGRKKEDSAALDLKESVRLRSGDLFQVRFDGLVGCHVYVLFLSSQGDVTWLFPEEATPYGRWCYAGESHALPAQNTSYSLDDHAGREMIYVLAAPEPLPDVQGLTGILKRHGADLTEALLRQSTGAAHVQLDTCVIRHVRE